MLTFLGVPEDDVIRDYLLTNEELLPFVQPLMDQFRAVGGDPELLRPVLGVQRSYLDAAFDQMRQQFGTLDRYLTDGLHIDAATQQALRAALIEQMRSNAPV